jgi:hypothetical protein
MRCIRLASQFYFIFEITTIQTKEEEKANVRTRPLQVHCITLCMPCKEATMGSLSTEKWQTPRQTRHQRVISSWEEEVRYLGVGQGERPHEESSMCNVEIVHHARLVLIHQ